MRLTGDKDQTLQLTVRVHWKDAMPTRLPEVGTASRKPSRARADHQKVFPGTNTIKMTN